MTEQDEITRQNDKSLMRAMRPERNNRLWLPGYDGIQATFVLCNKCGEAYEASLEHICMKVNSYPCKWGRNGV